MAQLTGLNLAKVDARMLASASKEAVRPIYDINWVAQELSAASANSTPAKWLVVGPLTSAIASAAEARNVQCVSVPAAPQNELQAKQLLSQPAAARTTALVYSLEVASISSEGQVVLDDA
eukprot:COSAG02_NODE_11738_length_1664_cov_1.563578_2_plen_119_part_01